MFTGDLWNAFLDWTILTFAIFGKIWPKYGAHDVIGDKSVLDQAMAWSAPNIRAQKVKRSFYHKVKLKNLVAAHNLHPDPYTLLPPRPHLRTHTHHDDAIKWKHFPRYWPFVRGFHRSPVNSPHKGQWRGALVFSLICARINGWVNNREAGDLRRHGVHYDVAVMYRLSNVCWIIHEQCLK